MYCYTLLCVFCRVPPTFPLLPLFPYENSVVHPYSGTANDIERRVREGSRPLVSM